VKRIQSIPTVYNGTTFRSRTEARWAYFFDRQRISYQYEPEGFQTTEGWYLPDFRFSEAPSQIFFEVKPDQPTKPEYRLLRALADNALAHVFVAHGSPSANVFIEKVYASGRTEQWFFAYEHETTTCGYLTTQLWGGGLELAIKQVANPMGAYASGPANSLDEAGRVHIDHRPPGRIRASSSLRESKLVRGDGQPKERKVVG
jgi:hypothetical protein